MKLFAVPLLPALLAAPALALDSIRLTDVVRSTGAGDIDLLRDVTPAALEAYRQESAGALTFAVDVNEASSGSESHASQGVTLASVTLRVTIGGSAYAFADFRTSTQALVAPAGSVTRALYYTAVGDGGSNRIAGNAIQGEFDATLVVRVDRDLSAATAAVLEVRLLQTNVALGDPEAFYDFSNGYEDLALLGAPDAAYLEALAPGRDTAPAVLLTTPPADPSLVVASWESHPAAGAYYTVGYEDLFPALGDYDFNDLVVAYRVDVGKNLDGQVVALRGGAFLVARGAGRSHDWRLRLALGGAAGLVETISTNPSTFGVSAVATRFSGTADIMGFADTRALLPPPPGFAFANTELGSPYVRGPRLDFTVSLDAPVTAAAVSPAPFDPYLVVRQSGYEVHLPGLPPTSGSANVAAGLTSFRDAAGYPFAFVFPSNWKAPSESVDLRSAYPRLGAYVSSAERQDKDWYAHPAPSAVTGWTASDWEWAAPAPP